MRSRFCRPARFSMWRTPLQWRNWCVFLKISLINVDHLFDIILQENMASIPDNSGTNCLVDNSLSHFLASKRL